MIIDPDSLDEIWYPTQTEAGGRWLTEDEFLTKWRTNAKIPTHSSNEFDSALPDIQDINVATPVWLDYVRKGIVGNQQLQMENFALAINTSWYNKMALPSGASIMGGAGVPAWTGGSLEEFLPEIGNLATGMLSAIDLGAGLYGEIGTAMGGEGSATTQAIDVAEAVMGAALGAMTAIAVVNPIVGAVIAVGFGIAKAATRESDRRAAKAAADMQDRRDDEDKFYSELEPLPSFEKMGDDDAMKLVLDRMPTDDYTSLYIPRYAPDKAWFGQLRQNGFVFGPGTPGGLGGQNTSRQWGEGQFSYNDYGGVPCLGMIPGTQQISDLVLSRLSPDVIKYWNQEIAGGDTPSGVNTLWEGVQYPDTLHRIVGEYVQDTGDFFPSSSQTLTFMWGNMQMQGASGNPDLYKINMPYIDGQWRSFIGNGWDYLKNTCTTTVYEFERGDHSMATMIKKAYRSQGRRQMIEAEHACAIACMFGTWRCDSSYNVIPKGEGWRSYRAGKGTPACDLDANAFPFKGQDSKCRESIYDSYLKDRIHETHQFQWKMLSASLVCAYVRESYAAFTPPSFVTDGASSNAGAQAADLKEKLRAMRDHLLVRPDQWRFLVEANVPRGEDHRGSDWYGQLDAVGAFKDQSVLGRGGGTSAEGYGRGGLAVEAGQGFEESAPEVMPLVGRVPMADAVPRSVRSGGGGGGLAAVAALGLGAVILSRR